MQGICSDCKMTIQRIDLKTHKCKLDDKQLIEQQIAKIAKLKQAKQDLKSEIKQLKAKQTEQSEPVNAKKQQQIDGQTQLVAQLQLKAAMNDQLVQDLTSQLDAQRNQNL